MSDERMPRSLVRVAQVLSDTEVVINKGKVDGIEMGHSFLFYAIGADILDPETGENLGPLELIRGRGRVVHLQEKIATVRCSESVAIYESSPAEMSKVPTLADLISGFSRKVSRYEQLPFRDISKGDFGRPI